MNIGNDLQAYNFNKLNAHSTPTTELRNNLATPTDTVSISNSGKSAEEKWQQISEKYDVANMSQTEVGKMTAELSENKLIPQEVLLHMLAPASMNQDFEQKYNILGKMHDSFESAKMFGGSQDQIDKQKLVVEIFEQLNVLHSKTSAS